MGRHGSSTAMAEVATMMAPAVTTIYGSHRSCFMGVAATRRWEERGGNPG